MKVRPLQRQFRRMIRDLPRNTLPDGACWTLQDAIVNLGAPARTRGGYVHYSDDITAVVGTASYVIAGMYADQLPTPRLLAIDEDGNMARIAVDGTGDVTDVGATRVTLQNPVQLGAKVVIPASDGTSVPKKWDGTTLADLGGSPPAGKYAAVWKALLLLANTNAQPQRLYFSTADYNPDTWDTTNTYWDFGFPVKGLGPMRNAVLVFGDDYTSRLRGSTPPPGGDLIADDPLFNIGCCDARSIATWNEQVVWADTNGVYLTDGTVPVDLTKLCGVKSFWQEQFSGFSSSWTVCGGVLRDHYFLTVMDGATFKLSASINLERYEWVAHTNLDGRCLFRSTSVGGSEKLFMGRRGAARLAELSTLFTPAAAYKQDADGDNVLLNVETPYYELGVGKDRIRDLYVTYDLREATAGDDPTWAVSYVTSPEATSYTSAGTLRETTERTRLRTPINRQALGAAFKITQAGPTSDGRLWEVAVSGRGQEPSKV